MTGRRLVQAFERIQPQLAEAILSDCNAFVRMQSGELAGSARVERGGRQIVWSTAYAKRVYYTGAPRRNVNAGASLRWCEKARAARLSDWAGLANRLIGGG